MRNCNEENAKTAETRVEGQTIVLSEENPTSVAKQNQTAINAKKSQVSLPENQTIVTYTDDELVSFKDNMVSKDTKAVFTLEHLLQFFFTKVKLLNHGTSVFGSLTIPIKMRMPTKASISSLVTGVKACLCLYGSVLTKNSWYLSVSQIIMSQINRSN